jgi:RNA polymerase sigma-70 factor (ECF subfamily)
MDRETEISELDRLWPLVQGGLLRDAVRLTRNKDDAWDLLQDVYERAHASFASLRPGSNGPVWLRTIMRRIFIDQWRRTRRWREVELPDELPALTDPTEDPLPWDTISADDVHAAILRLPREQRTLVEGHSFRHETYAALAGRLNIPMGTVGTRLLRGRGRLRRLLLDRSFLAKEKPVLSSVVA